MKRPMPTSDVNAPQVISWEDERLPRLWQPRRGEWIVLLFGSAALFSLVAFCGLGCFVTIWNPDRGSFGMVWAATTILGAIMGGIFGLREIIAEKRRQAVLQAELSENDLQDLLRLVKRVFKEEQWVLIEPVKIADQADNWIVNTNPEGIGCNGFLVVDKKTNEVLRKGFLPR